MLPPVLGALLGTQVQAVRILSPLPIEPRVSKVSHQSGLKAHWCSASVIHLEQVYLSWQASGQYYKCDTIKKYDSYIVTAAVSTIAPLWYIIVAPDVPWWPKALVFFNGASERIVSVGQSRKWSCSLANCLMGWRRFKNMALLLYFCKNCLLAYRYHYSYDSRAVPSTICLFIS